MITSAMLCIISVCLFTGLCKNQLNYTKFCGTVAHGPWKKRLDFESNFDYLTVR